MKLLIRKAKVMYLFPKVGFLFLLFLIVRVSPFVKIKHFSDNKKNISKKKVDLRNSGLNTGGYMGNKIFAVYLSKPKLNLFEFTMYGDQNNNLLHFYLLRSAKIFNHPFFVKNYNGVCSNKRWKFSNLVAEQV
jgi:hypothetical protein